MPQSPLIIKLSEPEYHIYCRDRLAEALAAAQDKPFVVVDFSGVRYIDSTALSELILCRKRRAARGYPPKRFAGVSSAVRRVLTTTNLNTIWPMFDSVADAVRSFKE